MESDDPVGDGGFKKGNKPVDVKNFFLSPLL